MFLADNQLHHYTSSLSSMFGYDLVQFQREVLMYIQMIIVDDTSVLGSVGACFKIMLGGGIMEVVE